MGYDELFKAFIGVSVVWLFWTLWQMGAVLEDIREDLRELKDKFCGE